MGFLITTISLFFGSPFGILVFGSGVIIGYLLSESQRNKKAELDHSYDELNIMLLEREGRIDKLEEYIDDLLDQKEQEPRKFDPAIQKSSLPDDLTRIEGIGPKTAEVLNNNGIHTYTFLSETSLDSLTQILEEAGSAYLRHGHETWAKQALLAANDEWEALEAWQDKN